MRSLKQICVVNEFMKVGELSQSTSEILALDENGELWFGTLETTEDKRRVIDWTPVNRPKDGASYSEPQLSFFDKWERDARAIIEADRARDAVSLATEDEADAKSVVEAVQASPDDDLENGEGTDPNQ